MNAVEFQAKLPSFLIILAKYQFTYHVLRIIQHEVNVFRSSFVVLSNYFIYLINAVEILSSCESCFEIQML